MNKKECAAKKTSIGGQALIEGVMMRGKNVTAMSIRLPDNTIEYRNNSKHVHLKIK